MEFSAAELHVKIRDKVEELHAAEARLLAAASPSAQPASSAKIVNATS